VVNARALASLRAPWFEVSCCPPNVARTFASLAAYIATVDGSGLQLHQFAPATIDTVLGDGRRIAVEVETDYPRSGRVVVRVVEAPADEMSLSLRVPSWAAGATLLVGGLSREVAPGYATETRVFSAGGVIELNLPMRARFTRPDSRIDAIRGSVAVERGPEVFALESSGMEGLGSHEEEFSRIEIDDTVEPAETGRVGEADAGARLTVSLRVVPEPTEGWPYAPELRAAEDAATFTAELLPYHSWGNRGTSTMRIWLPTVGA
jgi:DUF1680 family protein